MNIFWKTIALYNSSTWFYQLLISLLGIFLTVLLINKPRKWVKLGMKAYLIFINLWIAFVYYHIYCAERNYNEVMTVFWGIMAGIWVVDAIMDYTTFERGHKYDFLAYLFLFMPFLYPVLSLMRGLEFPGITSPVMPCSVAVFTIGLLLMFSRKINMFLVLFLCHWSLIGLSKTYFFNIPEDFLLASASVPALYLFFKEYFTSGLHKETKPGVKLINWLLIILCIIVGVALTISLFVQLAQG